MRKGYDPGWMIEDGKMILVSLGADFCAEHEWGINEIKQRLGIDGVKLGRYGKERATYTKPHGIERRRISMHDAIKLYEYRDQVMLLCREPWLHTRFEEDIEKLGKAKAMKERRPRELGLMGEETLGAAWDSGSFGLIGKGEDAQRIRELYAEIEKHNVAIWNGGRIHPFQNGGLILAIIDRVKAEDLETLRAADEDAEKLQAASDATGIIKRLEEAQKGFYACSPRWFDTKFKPQNEEKKTAYPVIYWLNPMEQQENNHGYFTVEELDLWIKGEGPIPMKAKTTS